MHFNNVEIIFLWQFFYNNPFNGLLIQDNPGEL